MTAAPLDKILLYIEPNERGLESARYAVALARRYAGDLHVVSVVNEQALEDLLRARIFLKEEGIDLQRDLEEDGKRYLAFVEKLAREKDLHVSTELLRGVVHREVVAKAKEVGPVC